MAEEFVTRENEEDPVDSKNAGSSFGDDSREKRTDRACERKTAGSLGSCDEKREKGMENVR